MTDKFDLVSITNLLTIILNQYKYKKSILGIDSELFFKPNKNKILSISRFGKSLESPIGVAAGPQTQLAQNIIVSWLCGARFIELKTVQTLDEVEISKPCIDMQDEGYNCEWSQELKLSESFDQYLNAWIIIHILKHEFAWDSSNGPGVVFNMSVGYDYKGILNKNIQWFFNKMDDASVELNLKINSLKNIYPEIEKIKISPQISNNITLSTMHGCPPDEIERIGEYLICEKKIHTSIKLNPTLLGKDKLNEILLSSGFQTKVPDIAFEHDLNFTDAIKIINNLQQKADENNLQFSLKLTNTLESLNNKEVFNSNVKMMYMSGRALHPISINLAHKIQKYFDGKLDISFSGGADAFNIVDIFNSGLSPITVCTDLLKPGGYGRLNQYIKNLNANKKEVSNKLEYLKNYADKTLTNSDYHDLEMKLPNIKTNRPLGTFDCINAPCVDTCPTNQAIPDYLYYTSKSDFKKAAEVIKLTNPFPHTTGMICDHLCQTKCTRINYDGSLLIREIKRFVSENTTSEKNNFIISDSQKQKTAAIIGTGPSGLTCAYYLAKAGVKVEVYEKKKTPGGMISGAIPSFRLSDEAINVDINNITNLGVKINYDFKLDKEEFEILRTTNDFVYLGIGAQVSTKLNLNGISSVGVIDPLDFLFKAKQGKPTGIGKNVVIIGGGNTAMDAARTAYRLVGNQGKITIVYRRKIKQMPADNGEIKAVLEEGINILELTSPVSVLSENDKIHSLKCKKMILGEKDESGRERPLEIPNSEFLLDADTIIPAVGQQLNIDFVKPEDLICNNSSYQTKLKNVFIGGDALRGASTAINAIGDGRKAAQEIINLANIEFETNPKTTRKSESLSNLMIAKTQRIKPQTIVETDVYHRKNFNLISTTLTKEEAIQEASRCLKCDEICSVCVTVCPNLAFHTYQIHPEKYQLQKLIIKDKIIDIIEGNKFEVNQKYQIIHIADWCNQCGNCNTFCPTSQAPYLEKPHLYLNKKSFEENKDGCHLNTENGKTILYFYMMDKQCNLQIIENSLLFESEIISLNIDANSLIINDIRLNTKSNIEIDISKIAEMYFIMQGAVSFCGNIKLNQ